MDPLYELLARWGHVIAGICWIGLLYFFNFVNVPFQGSLDAPTKKVVNPQLLLRALWWFRWAAMATLVLGLVLFVQVYMVGKNIRFPEGNSRAGEITDRALTIMVGMTLAIVMWFNVWFIIWPAQKRIIAGLMGGTPAPPELGKRALLASRFNTFASGPMLFLMLGSAHMPGDADMKFWLVAFLVPLVAVYLCIKASSCTGKPA